jgi:hypothetical protein
VRAFDGQTLGLLENFYAYNGGFTGGVFVAAGDVNRDGKADIIVGPGPGMEPLVQVFDSKPVPLGVAGFTIASFDAFDPTFTGGVAVGSEDLNGDGIADILTGAGFGGGPHVKAFDLANNTTPLDFFAFDPSFNGGVYVG